MIIKIIFDAVLINLAFILSYYLRFKILLFITPASLPIFEKYLSVLVFVTIVWLAVFKLLGLYDNKRFTALVDEIANLFGAVSLSTLILFGLLFLYRELWFSRLVVVNAWWLSFLLLAVSRLTIFMIIRDLRRRGFGCKNTLVIGADEISQTLVSKINHDQGLGYRLVETLSGLEDINKIKQVIRGKKVTLVIIADPQISAARTLDLITECERFGLEFKLVPGMLELVASRIDADELAGIPLLTVTEIRLKGLNALIKRGSDIILSGFGLILLSPLFLFLSLLIKITSPGPIFFLQTRVGLDEKEFRMYKFRSMVTGADEMISNLTPLSEVDGLLFKIKNDPRLTPLGKFMRRFSFDELPQLANVFFGQMSLVGPRPPLPREVSQYNSWQKKRLRVRPGITGPWQVSGRSLLPFEDMVRLDLYYIENWSLWLDFKILLRTIPVTMMGSGAY